MLIEVDPRLTVPPYEQLRAQVRALVDRGDLRPGDRLPTVRQLGKDLGVAPGTVARAYRELEQDGVVEGRGRNGTVVAARAEGAERRAQEATIAYLATLERLDLGPADVPRLVAAVRPDTGARAVPV